MVLPLYPRLGSHHNKPPASASRVLCLQLCRLLNCEERLLISLRMCPMDLWPAALCGNKSYVWTPRAWLTRWALSGSEKEYQGMAGGEHGCTHLCCVSWSADWMGKQRLGEAIFQDHAIWRKPLVTSTQVGLLGGPGSAKERAHPKALVLMLPGHVLTPPALSAGRE